MSKAKTAIIIIAAIIFALLVAGGIYCVATDQSPATAIEAATAHQDKLVGKCHFHLILIKAVEPCGCLCFKVLINCLYILDDIISNIVIVFKSDINYIGLLFLFKDKAEN